MKKLNSIIFVLFISLNTLFATQNLVITTYKNPNISDLDVLYSFIDELNKLKDPYYIIDYEVFSSLNDQNYAWALYKDNLYSGTHLELLVDNGKFIIENNNYENKTYTSKTFGSNLKPVFSSDAPDNIKNKLKDFTEKCYSLQKKNGRSYRGDSFYKLFFLNYDYLNGYRLTSHIKRCGKEYIKGTVKPFDLKNKYPIQDQLVNEIFSMSNNAFSLVTKNCVLNSANLYSPSRYKKKLTRFINVTYYDEQTNTESYYNEYEILDNTTKKLTYTYEEAYSPIDESYIFTDNDKERIRNILTDDVYITGFIVDHNEILKTEFKKQERKQKYKDYFSTYPYKHFINFGASFVPYPNIGFQLDIDYNYALGRITLGPGFSYNSQTNSYYDNDSSWEHSTYYTNLIFGVPIRIYIIPQHTERFFLNIYACPNAQLSLVDDYYKNIKKKSYGIGCDFRVEGGYTFDIINLKGFIGYNISSIHDKGCITIGLASTFLIE